MFVDEKRQGEAIVKPPSIKQRVIDRAIDILENGGWCKHQMHFFEGGRRMKSCAMGALEMAALEINTTCNFVSHTLGDLDATAINRGLTPIGIASYNDAPTTTKQNVIGLLRRLREYV